MLQLNDKYFLDNFFCKDGRINPYKIKSITNDEYNYLETRYTDSQSIKETLHRIKYNIDIRPTCKYCGGPAVYYGKPNSCKGIFLKYCSISCASKDTSQQANDVKCSKYGNKNNYQKIKNTVLDKYGVTSIFNLPNIRQNNITSLQNEKTKQKRKETLLKKYGVDSYAKTEAFWNNYDKVKAKNKEYLTKRKNNTYNKSNSEEQSYILLKEKYQNIIRQYKSEYYPFACDFYIPELDLYIECNYHWTHGGKPYEGTDEDNLILETWKSKNSKYYDNAIHTWTDLDVRKMQIAKKHNLNYIIFYNVEELKHWLLNQQ